MLIFDNMQISSIENAVKVNIKPPSHIYFKPRRLHSFVFYLSGHCEYKYPDNNIFFGETGKFLYLPKGVPYEVIPSEKSQCIVINFNTANDTDFKAFGALYQNSSQIKDCMLSAMNIYRQQRMGYVAELFSLVYKIILLIQQNQIPDYMPARRLKKLEPAIDYIEKHYLEPDLKISELVKICNVSEKYFTTLFTCCFKTTAKQYIIRKKLDYAKTVLALTGTSVTDISEACGFSCIYYFSKFFKQHTGMTPTEYRQISMY